jgi:hypothetical protein
MAKKVIMSPYGPPTKKEVRQVKRSLKKDPAKPLAPGQPFNTGPFKTGGKVKK